MRKVGRASSASAAGSLTAERASTRPTAAEPSVNGRESANISSSGARCARPSEMLMTAKIARSAVTVMTRTATSAASQSQSPAGPDRTAKMMVASEPPRAETATLNASLMPRCRRWTTRVTAKPSTWATTSSRGVARSSPPARTRSPMENVCASRCHWTWTTRASLTTKATAQSTHGRVSAVGAPGSVRTTTTNSATAIAAREAVSSMIRWGIPRRAVRDSMVSTPFVIVVTSLRPAHAGPGHPGPRHAGPGHPGPRHAGPRHPGPAHAGPRHPGPVGAGAQAVRPLAGVEGPAADVDLTADRLPADGHVDRTTGELQGADTGREREGLLRVGRGGGVLGGPQVDQAGALLLPGGGSDGLGRAGQQRLHLVRRDGGTLRDQQRRGTGHDGGGLRGAAAPEETLPDPGSRVRGVQVGPRVPEADHLLARSDEVGVAGAVTVVRERRDGVVGRGRRAVGVVAADGDHVRVVGRVVDLLRTEALVADGDDDHDSLVPGLLGRVGQRVHHVALDTVGTERHVQHPDVQTVLVAVLDDPVDGRDGLRDVGLTLGVSDLDADDAGVRRHADEVRRVPAHRGRGGVTAGDDAGHGGPVTVGVEVLRRAAGLERQVRAVDDLARPGQPVDRDDARVD